jgi:hypothetical protein
MTLLSSIIFTYNSNLASVAELAEEPPPAIFNTVTPIIPAASRASLLPAALAKSAEENSKSESIPTPISPSLMR